MSGGWVNSTRRDRLPADWHKRRSRVRRRDGYRCTATLNDGSRCPGPADAVDHVKPDYLGGANDEANLASLCNEHHGLKSSAEGHAAYNAKRLRPTGAHPGLISTPTKGGGATLPRA